MRGILGMLHVGCAWQCPMESSGVWRVAQRYYHYCLQQQRCRTALTRSSCSAVMVSLGGSMADSYCGGECSVAAGVAHAHQPGPSPAVRSVLAHGPTATGPQDTQYRTSHPKPGKYTRLMNWRVHVPTWGAAAPNSAPATVASICAVAAHL